MLGWQIGGQAAAAAFSLERSVDGEERRWLRSVRGEYSMSAVMSVKVRVPHKESEFFVGNLLVRVHFVRL